jgi:maltose O-acetyltransferase
MRAERVTVLAAELYDPTAPELAAGRERARTLCQPLNAVREAEQQPRRRLPADLF